MHIVRILLRCHAELKKMVPGLFHTFSVEEQQALPNLIPIVAYEDLRNRKSAACMKTLKLAGREGRWRRVR